MPILSYQPLRCFGLFKRSIMQAYELPRCEVLDSQLIANTFAGDKIVFGIADDNVFTLAITIWPMAS